MDGVKNQTNEVLRILEEARTTENVTELESALGIAIGFIRAMETLPRFTKQDAKDMAMMAAANGWAPWEPKREIN